MGERIWMLMERLPDGLDREVLTHRENVAFPNMEDVEKQLGAGSNDALGMRCYKWSPAEAFTVFISLPELAFDFWHLTIGAIVSARLRKAWASASSAVEYVAVDAADSCLEAQAQDYRLMHVMAEATVVDPANSDYDIADQLDWLPKGFPFYVRSFAIRSDVAPPVPLFRDTFARNYIFCTDELAVRALSAGCMGIRFADPATQRLLQPIRYRTLEGIAETGDYDVVARRIDEKLVERIPLHDAWLQ